MLEKLQSQSSTVGCTFDYPRNIGNHKTAHIIDLDHAQIGMQCRKGIIRHFRTSRRYGSNQTGFTGIWHTQQAHIRNDHQFQEQIAMLAGRAFAGLLRSTIDTAFETGVAQTVKATFCHQQCLPWLGQIADLFPGVGLVDNGTGRHGHIAIFTFTSSAIATHPILASLGTKHTAITKIDQGIYVFRGNQIDATAIPTIPTIRSSQWNIFFTTKRGYAVAAVPCFHSNFCFVNESHNLPV